MTWQPTPKWADARTLRWVAEQAELPPCEDRWDAPCSGPVTHACEYAETLYVCDRHAAWRLGQGHPARALTDVERAQLANGDGDG